MTYIITEPCKGVKDAACVEVCPVDCIHSSDEEPMFYIDPTECVGCGACVWACPVQAIYHESDLPDHYLQYKEINAEKFRSGTLPK